MEAEGHVPGFSVIGLGGQVSAEPIIVVSEQRVARMGDRVVAVFLDGMVLFYPFYLSGSFIAVWAGAYRTGNYSMTGGPALFEIVVIGIIWIAYHTLFESLIGGTLGKRVMGIEIRSAQRTHASFPQVLVRNLLRPVDAIGFYLLGFLIAVCSKQSQRFGDFAAKTIVCEKENPRRRIATVMWVGFLIVEILACYLFRYLAARP